MFLDGLVEQARQRILHSSRVLIISHLRPDGDAVGSMLGLGLAFEFSGRHVQMVLEDGVPENMRFLEGSDKITRSWQEPVDLVIVVDCSDLPRVGKSLAKYGLPDINIDHHTTNLMFAAINLVSGESSATAELLVELIPAVGLDLTPAVCKALLTGILTDTIGFRTNNVSSHTLRTAARLMDSGVELAELYKHSLTQRSWMALRYWGIGLSGLKLVDRVAWIVLSLADRAQAGYSGRDDADLINILSSVKEIDIAIVFVEQTGGSVKISWRAQNGYDVSQVALQFGGGGHRAASGAEVKGSLAEVQDRVLQATRQLILEVS